MSHKRYMIRYTRDWFASDQYEHCRRYRGTDRDYPITIAGRHYTKSSARKTLGGVGFENATILTKKEPNKLDIWLHNCYEVIEIEINEPA